MESSKARDIGTVGLESDLGASTDTGTTENVDMEGEDIGANGFDSF